MRCTPQRAVMGGMARRVMMAATPYEPMMAPMVVALKPMLRMYTGI